MAPTPCLIPALSKGVGRLTKVQDPHAPPSPPLLPLACTMDAATPAATRNTTLRNPRRRDTHHREGGKGREARSRASCSREQCTSPSCRHPPTTCSRRGDPSEMNRGKPTPALVAEPRSRLVPVGQHHCSSSSSSSSRQHPLVPKHAHNPHSTLSLHDPSPPHLGIRAPGATRQRVSIQVGLSRPAPARGASRAAAPSPAVTGRTAASRSGTPNLPDVESRVPPGSIQAVVREKPVSLRRAE